MSENNKHIMTATEIRQREIDFFEWVKNSNDEGAVAFREAARRFGRIQEAIMQPLIDRTLELLEKKK